MKKQQSGPGKRAFSFKERFDYWFDNRMARGSLGLIRSLVVASILLALIIAGIIVALGFNGESDTATVFWDSIATVINAWMPSYEDGGPGYLILMSIVAIAGVLFTSVLIGIITSTIEEKIIELRKGNSRVLESGHIVVLGLYAGEFTLLRQLVLAAENDPLCIVVAEEMEREEMEDSIRSNVDVPKNVRIVCRTADITDPADLEKCSMDTSRTVIISPTDDIRTVKALLAVSAVLQEKQVSVPVNAIISKREYRFPPSIAQAHNITALQSNDMLAKMIAHSCTQTGLSETFREVFNFDGNELFLTDTVNTAGMTFAEVSLQLDRAVPVGVRRGGSILLNPPADLRLEDGEPLLVFSEDRSCAALTDGKQNPEPFFEGGQPGGVDSDPADTVIIGCNETLPVILRELPENIRHVYLACGAQTEDVKGALESSAEGRGMQLHFCEQNLKTEQGLLQLAQMADHVVVLNDHEKDEEDADMESIFYLMNLRDLRTRYRLQFNITAEMRKERNQNLVASGDRTDFVVASSMSSLCLAQIAESPELTDVFRELLSNHGNELYLKYAEQLGLVGTFSVRQLRSRAMDFHYVLLGYIHNDQSCFNPRLDETVTLEEGDSLIVLSEQ